MSAVSVGRALSAVLTGALAGLRVLAVAFIRLYQLTRFLRPPSCRFYPTCSEYTAGSIKLHGLPRGVFLGVVRICKCHPWHDGGVDTVPDKFELKSLFPRTTQFTLHQWMQR